VKAVVPESPLTDPSKPKTAGMIVIPGTFGVGRRTIYVINRLEPNGRRRETSLVICSRGKAVLMFNRLEFDAFVERLPWIKEQLTTYAKKIGTVSF